MREIVVPVFEELDVANLVAPDIGAEGVQGSDCVVFWGSDLPPLCKPRVRWESERWIHVGEYAELL